MTDCRCVVVGNMRASNLCPVHGPKRQADEATIYTQGFNSPTDAPGTPGHAAAQPAPVKATDAGPAPKKRKPRSSAAGKSGPVGRSVWNPATGLEEPK
jgi:hypothetical protein